ncbi:DedA family protein [Kordiimonas lipolytica]|uniref:DedA family protein n=1 Tax=Kordiimonas lipolytica TaxID=1662421 RepID=A0ABV8UDT8_9PROT|nr:VTT domain-containing protein [Kordiimonas lipolytica]
MTITPDTLLALAEELANQPLLLACVLALATLVTEDGTLIAGSLMVGAGMATAPFVIAAVAFGIAAGDVGLYGIGAAAQKSRWLRKRLPLRKAREFRRWLEGRSTPVLFASRFLPGTRLPTYLTFGFLRMPLLHFTLVMSVAAMVWVTLMVFFVSEVQKAVAHLGGWAGITAGILVAVGLIMLSHRLVRKSRYGDRLEGPQSGAENAN